jgi:hypothetical protein
LEVLGGEEEEEEFQEEAEMAVVIFQLLAVSILVVVVVVVLTVTATVWLVEEEHLFGMTHNIVVEVPDNSLRRDHSWEDEEDLHLLLRHHRLNI